VWSILIQCVYSAVFIVFHHVPVLYGHIVSSLLQLLQHQQLQLIYCDIKVIDVPDIQATCENSRHTVRTLHHTSLYFMILQMAVTAHVSLTAINVCIALVIQAQTAKL
jgi:hypothetical protein